MAEWQNKRVHLHDVIEQLFGTENTSDSSASSSDTENYFDQSDNEAENIEDLLRNAKSVRELVIEQSTEDLIYDIDSENGWKRDDHEPILMPFEGKPGLKCDLPDKAEPIDFFYLLFDEGMWDILVRETNKYALRRIANADLKPHSRLNEWRDVTVDEMKVFFALVMAMGLVRKSDVAQYWSTKECVSTAFFGKYMTRNRFHLILTNLRIADNSLVAAEGQPGFDKLSKVRPFVSMLHKNFLKYEPDRDITFDEGLCPFKGRLNFRVYNPMKPSRCGIKLYQVREAQSGYTVGFDVNHGDTDVIQYVEALEDDNTQGSYSELSTATKIVIGMLAFCGLLSKGHHVYMDSNFTSPELMEELDLLNTYACGTLRINREGVPKAIQSVRNLGRGEAIFRRKENMLALKYHDKKDVNMLTTIHSASFAVMDRVNRHTHESFTKPVPIVEYCKKMGGVEFSDQVVQYYEVLRKSVKWWRKLFFHLFNLMIVNSYILYKKYSKEEKKKTHYDFRAEIIASLIQTAPNAPRPTFTGRQTLEPIDRLTGRHFLGAIEPKPGAKKQAPTRPCVVCNVNGKRKETTFQCKQCRKALCVRNCFERYHTVKNYRVQKDH